MIEQAAIVPDKPREGTEDPDEELRYDVPFTLYLNTL